MSKGRLEAFSDAVIAILITIMVLELKVPEGSDLEALRPMVPVFLAYGGVLLLAGVAYYILCRTLVRHSGPHSALAVAVGKDMKGKASVVLYAAAVALAFVSPWIADAIYVSVALMWLIPDRRIESTLHHQGTHTFF